MIGLNRKGSKKEYMILSSLYGSILFYVGHLNKRRYFYCLLQKT